MERNISPYQKLDYLKTINPKWQEFVAQQIYDGEKLEEALNSIEGQSLITIISNVYQSEFNSLMNLVTEKKYNEGEELWRIREHCIALDKLNDILRQWKGKLSKLNQHMEKIEKLDNDY